MMARRAAERTGLWISLSWIKQSREQRRGHVFGFVWPGMPWMASGVSNQFLDVKKRIPRRRQVQDRLT